MTLCVLTKTFTQNSFFERTKQTDFYSSRSAVDRVPATLVDAEVSASNLDAAIARVTAELGPPTSAAGAPSAAGKRTLLQQQVRFIILFQYVVSLNPS